MEGGLISNFKRTRPEPRIRIPDAFTDIRDLIQLLKTGTGY
jgi:hypothetical protein